MSKQFPPTLKLEFSTVAQHEACKRAAAARGMSAENFLLWLFADYQRTNCFRKNVVDLGQFIAVKRERAITEVIAPVSRKPMARAIRKTNLGGVSRQKKAG